MSPSHEDPQALPDWPAGTVVILVTAGDHPHAIPVSAVVRAGERRLLLGLARSRESLARLREDPRVAVSILTAGDVAVSAYGAARVIDEHLTDAVAAVEVAVHRIQDHNRPTFSIDAPVSWQWTDEAARARDAEVRAALARLAAGEV